MHAEDAEVDDMALPVHAGVNSKVIGRATAPTADYVRAMD